VSGALGNVQRYDFGDYEVFYYCFIHSSWEVGGEVGVFFFIFSYVESLGEGRKWSFAMIVW